VNYGLAHIDKHFTPAMEDVARWVHYVPSWSAAIEKQSNGVFKNVYGFVDVICQRICRPSSIIVNDVVVDVQRAYYCGYKGHHLLKWQGIMSPWYEFIYVCKLKVVLNLSLSWRLLSFCSGILFGLSGPFLGTESDSECLQSSGVLRMLAVIAWYYEYQFGIFGDPAYPRSPVLFKPFVAGAYISAAQRVYNYFGSRGRVTVEWFFGNVQQYWATVCKWKTMRLHAVPVPRYMRAAVFLSNCINCHYPNQMESYFDCKPPSLRTYFAIMRLPVQGVNEYPHY